MNHKDKLPDEERIARRKEAAARYRAKNRDKCREATLKSQSKNPERKREYDAAWRVQQADHIKAQQIEYRVANREWINAQAVAWQKGNQEVFKAYQKQYAIDNSDHQKAKAKKWREDNPDRSALSAAQWAAGNRDRRVINEQRRRAKKIHSNGDLGPDSIKRLLVLQKGKCVVCLTDLKKTKHHLDHIMPLSKGGEHSMRNVQLLCPRCNLTKSAKHPVDFMQEKGFLL
jgi:5-methylcytosine-specific restriction endonuclease McrA